LIVDDEQFVIDKFISTNDNKSFFNQINGDDLVTNFMHNPKDSKLTIIGYGQSGSGKSSRFIGGKSNPGLIYLFGSKIFDLNIHHKYAIHQATFEIYLDQIYDLSEKNLHMAINKTCQNVCNILAKDLKKKQIKEIADLKVGLENIIKNRHVDDTALNHNSSRSHVCHIWYLFKKESGVRSIAFFDLAGAENSEEAKTAGIYFFFILIFQSNFLSIIYILRSYSNTRQLNQS